MENTSIENSITVTVIQSPSTVRPVVLQRGATYADAISAAGFSADGQQVRSGGAQIFDLSAEVQDNSRVILNAQIKGN